MNIKKQICEYLKLLFCSDIYVDCNLQDKYDDLQIKYEMLKKKNKELNEQIPKVNNLEKYWNSKIEPLNDYQYRAKNGYNIDPRIYFTEDNNLPLMSSNTNDDKAMEALNWVIKRVKYTRDIGEDWKFAFRTFKDGKGDCEDGAILLANIMITNGIPYWRIRINAGNVKEEGHAYVTYLREEDNEWYVLDWCYWPSDSLQWLKWKDAEKYFGIWFSFNKKNIFIRDELDR